MANIRVDVDYQIVDGQPLTFKAPCPCSEIEGLTVYYAIGQGKILSKEFVFKDAHGNALTNVNNLFDANAYVKVILNTKDGIAYLQNADTNGYLEGRFNAIEKATIPISRGGTGGTTKVTAIKNLGIFPVESVYITSTYKTPSTFLGGTWKCYDQGLAYKLFDSNVDHTFFTPSNKVKSWIGLVSVEGHYANIKLEIISNVDIGDDDTVWGTFNFDKLGFDELMYSITPAMCASDSANILMEGSLDYKTGEFKTYDVFPKLDGGVLKAGEGFVTTFTVPISTDAMKNSACDKFYWKRTA